MKLPWREKTETQEKLEELKQEIEELEEEKKKYREQLTAEKERRSKLSSEKQEAEEKLNKLQDKLRNYESVEKEEETGRKYRWEKPRFEQLKKNLEKLSSVESPEEDLVTVLSPTKVSDLPDLKGLKNSLSKSTYTHISSEKSFIAFLDEEFFQVVLKSRPFFESDWMLENNFSAEKLLDLINSEKYWALVSAGRTRVFEEQGGYFEEVEDLKTRVENQQKKGGFSQGRFERKRDEQIEEHLERAENVLEDLENVKLLGERSLCEDLSGEYLGGFDSSKSPGPDMFYGFRLKKTVEKIQEEE